MTQNEKERKFLVFSPENDIRAYYAACPQINT